jgi:hypothetical protein
VPDAAIARRHRIGIGTIVAEANIVARFRNGTNLGHIEERFIARLAPGDCFVFAGRVLEFVRMRELTAWVKPAPANAALVLRWTGGRMALSTTGECDATPDRRRQASCPCIAGTLAGATAARTAAALVGIACRQRMAGRVHRDTRRPHGLYF